MANLTIDQAGLRAFTQAASASAAKNAPKLEKKAVEGNAGGGGEKTTERSEDRPRRRRGGGGGRERETEKEKVAGSGGGATSPTTFTASLPAGQPMTTAATGRW